MRFDLNMSEDNAGDSSAKSVDSRAARRRQDALGRRLRQMYDEVVEEPIPEDFLGFLKQADERTPAAPGTDPASAQPGQGADRKDG